MDDENPWKELGACLSSSPELFFSEWRDEIERAKAICAKCPVRVQCLDYAMKNREKTGVWGGTSPLDRRRIRRLRRIPRSNQ